MGSTASQLKIAAPNGAGVDYAINGIAYHKADAATVAVTAADVQAVSTTCLYLVCLNATGTLSTIKGDEVANADVTAGSATIKWPVATSGLCPIGAFKITTDADTTFTAGTTNFSASGITDTYYDLLSVPTAPLAS